VSAIRVLLAEDHETVRHGLRLLIESQTDMAVVGEANDGRVAVARAVAVRPDVVVLDLSMPQMNGLAATRELRLLVPEAAVVALTRYSDDAYVQELLGAGASAYVLKQSSPKELLRAIRAAAAGGQYLDSALPSRVIDGGMARRPGKGAARPSITERESEVLRLMALGHSNKEIASALDVSVKTVEVHKSNGMRKLNLRGRIDIVRFAVLQGWLHEP
jgi:DNA-binding NarL/FixJ family response regulator